MLAAQKIETIPKRLMFLFWIIQNVIDKKKLIVKKVDWLNDKKY